jgi:hypothetical protein
VTDEQADPHEDPGPGRRARTDYRHLPERPRPDELVMEQPSTDAPDPEMGRDPDRDWLLRGV